ncbi:MAG: ComEC/Rec2 family competence protein [Longimicrobiales bacterium]|nr:ComEC/Rec2 family competence protein [Longimicrobiales bacterium]
MALAFSAGVALVAGAPAWCGALLAVLILLRPAWPFHRPRDAGLAVALLVAAGAAVAAADRADRIEWTDRTAGEAPTAPPGFREAVRGRLQDGIRRTFPAEAPMVEALLLAERTGLDPAVRDAFTRTGAAHLLAISGFHVGILAGWVVLLLHLLRLGRARSALAAAAVVWGYVALLGFPTSAVRAALLLSGAALGRLRGRPVHALGGWGAALLLVALVDPASLTRPGAQLSFAGALGLILWVEPWGRAARRRLARIPGVGPLAHGRGWRARLLGGAAEAAAASAAAQVATLPLAVWHFQRVAVLALPVTLVATPLVSLALPGALLALAAGSAGIPGGRLLAAGVEALLWATRTLMAGMAAWDPGWLLGPAGVVAATAAGVGVWRLTRRRLPRPLRVAWSAGAVAAALLLAPLLEAGRTGGRLELHFLDVGQGDAIAVGTPGGRWVLVDTGAGSGERLARTLVARGIGRLEVLVLTHPDLDHMGAAAGLASVASTMIQPSGNTLRR